MYVGNEMANPVTFYDVRLWTTNKHRSYAVIGKVHRIGEGCMCRSKPISQWLVSRDDREVNMVAHDRECEQPPVTRVESPSEQP
jgi:CO dehydrogenase nickel-insertion accessory protein CooC1